MERKRNSSYSILQLEISSRTLPEDACMHERSKYDKTRIEIILPKKLGDFLIKVGGKRVFFVRFIAHKALRRSGLSMYVRRVGS